jgi:hypothetical protein
MDTLTVVSPFSRVFNLWFDGASRGCQANPGPLPNTAQTPSNWSALRVFIRIHPWPFSAFRPPVGVSPAMYTKQDPGI